MSDTMLLGVLRMPFGLAMATPIAQIQYHQRGVQAAGEIEKLTRERDDARAEAEQWRRDRRERIATAALQGMLSDPGASGTAIEYAEYAAQYADALIAELDKEAQP